MQISVVIPTYNRAHTIERALNSVLAQTYLPQEIIVVDDGSTDDTAKKIATDYPQVNLIRQSNRGVSHARNQAIKQANNDWIALLDSDDEWLPNKLVQQIEALNNNSDYKLCHCDEIWIRNGRRVNPKKKHGKQGGKIFQQCLALCAISPSASLMHKSLFTELGLFDESLPACEDYDLWLRITAKYPVLYVDKQLLVKYGGHNDQLSQQHWGMDRFRIQALEKIINTGDLAATDLTAAKDMLSKKLEIMINGAEKRNNTELLQCYRMKLHHYKTADPAKLPA